jgi:hypothetical protein
MCFNSYSYFEAAKGLHDVKEISRKNVRCSRENRQIRQTIDKEYFSEQKTLDK